MADSSLLYHLFNTTKIDAIHDLRKINISTLAKKISNLRSGLFYIVTPVIARFSFLRHFIVVVIYHKISPPIIVIKSPMSISLIICVAVLRGLVTVFLVCRDED